MKQDYKKTIEELSKQEVKFDFIFLDPPYQSNFAVDATKRILSLNLLNDKGNIIIETDDEKKELEQLEELNIKIKDIRKYGRVRLIFIEAL